MSEKLPSTLILISILIATLCPIAWSADGIPRGWQRQVITPMLKKTIDGDTFDVDLNRDGRLSKRSERVRLLYVDTPELSRSHKGKDRKFGIPAKQFLEEMLSRNPSVLWFNPLNREGRHGRILAILEVNGQNINLELIAQGHSYLDTRFSWPNDFERYSQAEILAFDRRRGIWSTSDSRQSYLERLKKEDKTVYSPKNLLFIPEKMPASLLDPAQYEGRFVHVSGEVIKVKKLRKGVQLLFLKHDLLRGGLTIVTFKEQRQAMKMFSLDSGDLVEIHGFISLYKHKTWQIRMHQGKLLNRN